MLTGIIPVCVDSLARIENSKPAESFDANSCETARIHDMTKEEALAYFGLSCEEPLNFSQQRPTADDELLSRANELISAHRANMEID